jgi:hypothetical protein
LERGLKPLSNGCLGIIIKINLTTNYQLLLNRNKVHRACPKSSCGRLAASLSQVKLHPQLEWCRSVTCEACYH